MTNEFDETIDGLSDTGRNPLEVLAAEFSAARRSGEQPSIEEFIQRVPDQREEARALLQSIALFERVSDQEYTRHATHRRQQRFVHKHHDQLGDFRIVREIGRGGMGIIYEAEQLSLKRSVALKVLGTGSGETAKQLERFQREAEAIARLHHTNIVPVFGSGSQDGVHYFAMQLIDGRPLSELPDLSFVEIARLGMQSASALAYAHSHGVLHRDIKPSNLLLDKSGEVWVTDFGLAKLSDVGELTQTGDIMGTLKYMAPEQLEGRADERTDIYALGLTLYELVTRQPAFDISKSLANRIRNHEFASPRSINTAIPRDLETIILKATACEPQHRYSTADEMADDLRSFMEDRPIAARRASSIERLARWMRRNPALATSLVATLLLLMATTLVTSAGYVTTRAALLDSKKARDEADLASRQANEARKNAEVSQGRAESNLNVALQAFDAIFDNVASRGVPQSLTLDMHEAANAESAETETAESTNTEPANSANLSNKTSAPRFEVTLNGADAELLNDLLKFYRQFAQQNGDDDALRARTALAYQRIGQIQHRLGQGTAAMESYDEALKLLTLLNQQHPHELSYILSIAKIYNDRGFALSSMSQAVPEIVNEHKNAIRFLEAQNDEIRRLADVRFEQARGYDLAGSILSRSGATSMDDLPIPTFGDALREGARRLGLGGPGPRQGMDPKSRPGFDRPPAGQPFSSGPPPNDRDPAGPGDRRDFPPDPNGQRPRPDGPRPDGPRGDGPRGGGLFGGPPGGPRMSVQAMIEADLRRADELLAELCDEFPERRDYRLAHAQAQRHLMAHFMSTNRMAEATEFFELARESLAELLERAPQQPEVLLELSDTLSTASARLTSLNALEAEKYLRQAIATCEQLCESFPSVPEYQALLANSHDKLGTVEARKGHWASADQAYLQATERLFDLQARFPEQRFYQLSTLQAATHLAELRLQPQTELNDEASLAAARGYLEKAMAAYQKTFTFGIARGSLGKANRVLDRLKNSR